MATGAPEVKPALSNKSGKFVTALERLRYMGVPDWFLQKASVDGQVTMARYADSWTAEKVKEFEKYDLNHDGVITADEVLKVEKRGGK